MAERRLGPFSAGALIIANMIGVGVFTTSGYSLGDLGRRDLVILAWCVGGVLAMCGALSYAALARRIPESGGEYVYLTRTLHPLAGFLAGWVSLVAGFTAPTAAAALAFHAYLLGSDSPAPPQWIATGVIVVAAGLHGLRTAGGVVVQNIVVGVKLLLIAVFIGIGLFALPATVPAAEAPATFSLGAFAVTLVYISFSYSGWNAAVYVAGEVRDPARNFQRTLVLATALVTLIYLALNCVFLFAAPVSELENQPEIAAVAAEAIGGVGLRRAVSILAAIALFTSVSAMVMAGPRVYARMAEDGVFPRFFARGRDAPTAAVALQAGLAVVVVWMTNLEELLGYIGFTLSVSAALAVVGLFNLRRREGADRVPITGYPWVPGVFILMTLTIAVIAMTEMIDRSPRGTALGVLTVAAGLPLYWLLRSGRVDSAHT